MRYSVLLRGINVGGKNKVVMAELRDLVAGLGFTKVETYINSGNLFFDSQEDKPVIADLISQLFAEHYPFITSFALLSQPAYEDDLSKIPDWWFQESARKDILFYTNQVNRDHVAQRLSHMTLTDNEAVHLGQAAAYWVKWDEEDYLKTSYHKQLLKEPFYKQVTIRNGRTFDKIGEFLKH